MASQAATMSRKEYRALSIGTLPRRRLPSLGAAAGVVVYLVLLAIRASLLAMGFAGAVFAGNTFHDYVFQGGYFTIHGVAVNGLVTLKREDVLRLSGIQEGGNTFRLDLEEIAKRISANPWVEEVSVRRELPEGIAVDIREREPFAKAVAGDKLYLIDRKGYVMARVESHEYKHLPVIGGGPKKEGNAEGVFYPRIFMTGLKLLKFSRESNLFRSPIAGVRIESPSEMTLITPGRKLEIRVDSRNLAAGLSRLESIFDYARMEGKTVRFIDLCYGKKAVVKFGEENE